MRLGPIQKTIIGFLSQYGENGAFIGSGTRAREFRGYSLEQVERAIASLLRRGLIQRKGICYAIAPCSDTK